MLSEAFTALFWYTNIDIGHLFIRMTSTGGNDVLECFSTLPVNKPFFLPELPKLHRGNDYFMILTRVKCSKSTLESRIEIDVSYPVEYGIQMCSFVNENVEPHQNHCGEAPRVPKNTHLVRLFVSMSNLLCYIWARSNLFFSTKIRCPFNKDVVVM